MLFKYGWGLSNSELCCRVMWLDYFIEGKYPICYYLEVILLSLVSYPSEENSRVPSVSYKPYCQFLVTEKERKLDISVFGRWPLT